MNITKLSFSHKSIKRIKREKDIIREEEVLKEIGFLVENGFANLKQIRFLEKYKPYNIIDYLEHHKKERIIIQKIDNYQIHIVDILFDHLGRDELDYRRYWEGDEELDLNQVIIFEKNELYKIFIKNESILFFKKISKI